MKRKMISLCAVAAVATMPQFAQAADPIKIGMVAESTGPNAEAGVYQSNGAKMAVEEINKAGGVLGRQLELYIEDNQSTNPGSVLALSKLTSRGDMTALIGTVRSTQIQAVSPTVKKVGLPMMIGGTDVGLTHSGNPWIFRARPNDGYSAKVIAEYGVNTLKLKKWAIVHSTDSFGNGGAKGLTASLKELGVTPVTVQGFTSNSQDMTPIVLAIKQSGADIVSTYIANSTDVAIFAKQLRQLGLTVAWVGSPSVSTDTAMKLAGDALHGAYSISDFAVGSSPEAQDYDKRYRAKYNAEPDLYSAWAYDAVQVLALGIKNSSSTKPDDIKKAIHAIKGYKGIEGTYTYDKNGDGLHGYNILKNDGGKIVFMKHIDFTPAE
ncbi:ABC transporter substrate-binding protein [Pollutimonas bauzanensis]|uniref:Branched-chain amino acid transport system substrate-binding protein n=1 Tax=Pollutimonas bauzanensis TaxID=658167 RepID=A0A1M5VK11_9BURK|nr:ABC transporter substrate-binding protein [Pollutimonas bauzanensis]SHH75612.1 branched-chain amino acid transport system substrate-binding protein [Pollutimonas bauzanensis]